MNENENILRVIVLTQGPGDMAISRMLELESIKLAGIFVETPLAASRGTREKLRRSIRYDGYMSTALKLARKLIGFHGSGADEVAAAMSDRDRLREIAHDHGVPIHFVADYHAEESIELMRAADADLGVVLGTNILKESVFRVPRLGSINLHQGLAPYYRGCPAIFWELFNDEREVGLTIHYVESSVDTGGIILQRTVPLEYDYSSYGVDYEKFISDYRRKLIVPCANLVAEAVRLIAARDVSPQPQDCSLGKRYRLPVKKEKDELRRRLRERPRLPAVYSDAEKASTGD